MTEQLDNDTMRRQRIRVPLPEVRGLLARMVVWYSRRMYGDVLDPGLVMLHHPPMLRATVAFERKVARWGELDPDLKTLAEMASAASIGCSWCLDFGYYAAHSEGLRVDKLAELPRWRESTVFTDLERSVIEYAEAMTATPPLVTDEMVSALTKTLGPAGVVELTKMVAVENERSRFNSAMGLTSQGLADRCELPR